ncbi:MAG TPA: hypothetical protein VF516_04520 [Kofleriaceae bacterium]
MSELGVIASRNPRDRNKIGSIGVALPGVELRIAPDGELQARGGMTMRVLKANSLIGQVCVVGDNRAYLTALIVLDGQVAPVWAAARGIAYGSFAELTSHPEVRAEVERSIAALNERVSRVENIRKWTILPAEWTAESEELTPTLKLKRRVILQKYAPAITEMYGEADPLR